MASIEDEELGDLQVLWAFLALEIQVLGAFRCPNLQVFVLAIEEMDANPCTGNLKVDTGITKLIHHKNGADAGGFGTGGILFDGFPFLCPLSFGPIAPKRVLAFDRSFA